MALTEKSVELNLTSEILNYLGWKYGRPFYALGPSMKAEDRLGFDVSVRAPGQALLVQHKRAYKRNAGDLEWRLNRTTRKDQHHKLQVLEGAGLKVFYAFPKFYTAQQLSGRRYRLLIDTFWRRPLSINPKGGPVGHHEVRWHPITGQWTVSSEDPSPIEEPANDFVSVFDQAFERGDGVGYDELARAVNATFFGGPFAEGAETWTEDPSQVRDDMEGLCIIGWTNESVA